MVAHGYAELANRTNVNLHDMLTALDDLGTSVPELQTYLNALSRVRTAVVCTQHLECHAVWEAQIEPAAAAQRGEGGVPGDVPCPLPAQDDNTFAHALTDYPIRKPARVMPTWQDKGEEPPPHIPPFLPAFPDKHTYQRTATFAGHDTNPDKQAQVQPAGPGVFAVHTRQAGAGRGGAVGRVATPRCPRPAPKHARRRPSRGRASRPRQRSSTCTTPPSPPPATPPGRPPPPQQRQPPPRRRRRLRATRSWRRPAWRWWRCPAAASRGRARRTSPSPPPRPLRLCSRPQQVC